MKATQQNSTTNRRAFLRAAGAGTLGLAVATALSQKSEAARRWCTMDPIVLIDGQLADIYLSSDLAMLLSATGPTVLRISIPAESKGTVILNDLGFGLKGYDVKFVKDKSLSKTARHTEVVVAAYVPAKDSSLPVTVTFAPRALSAGLKAILFGTSADGHANEWIKLSV